MYDNPNRYEEEFELVATSGGARRRDTTDWPTVAVAVAAYGGWLAATRWHALLPAPVLVVLGGWLVAWHGSLQHETIHGRPTRRLWLNTLIGGWPLALWLPYGRYRQMHLAHHRCGDVTCPQVDPESRYLPRETAASRPQVALARLQSTLTGRLAAGPIVEVGGFLITEAKLLWRGDQAARTAWLQHAAAAAPVLVWLHACKLDLVAYLLCFVAPGAALTLLRSYAEHRAHADPRRRAAVVEEAPVLGLLFLNNNLHALHHAKPELSWWRLPAAYRQQRGAILEANGGLVYRGYGDVLARYWRKPHDVLIHPGLRP